MLECGCTGGIVSYSRNACERHHSISFPAQLSVHVWGPTPGKSNVLKYLQTLSHRFTSKAYASDFDSLRAQHGVGVSPHLERTLSPSLRPYTTKGHEHFCFILLRARTSRTYLAWYAARDDPIIMSDTKQVTHIATAASTAHAHASVTSVEEDGKPPGEDNSALHRDAAVPQMMLEPKMPAYAIWE